MINLHLNSLPRLMIKLICNKLYISTLVLTLMNNLIPSPKPFPQYPKVPSAFRFSNKVYDHGISPNFQSTVYCAFQLSISGILFFLIFKRWDRMFWVCLKNQRFFLKIWNYCDFFKKIKENIQHIQIMLKNSKNFAKDVNHSVKNYGVNLAFAFIII